MPLSRGPLDSPHARIVPSLRFSNRAARIAAVAMGSLFALVGLAGTTSSEGAGAQPRVVGGMLVVVGLWFACRGFLSATLMVNSQFVTTRAFVRSRSYPISELLDVEVEVGRTGLAGFGREYPVLQLADGSRRRFKELNSRPATSDEPPTVVQQAVEAIRAEIDT